MVLRSQFGLYSIYPKMTTVDEISNVNEVVTQKMCWTPTANPRVVTVYKP